MELAEAYLKVGDVQGDAYSAGVGDTRGAVASYTRALEISRTMSESSPGDVVARLYLARSYRSLGGVLPVLGKPSEGLSNLLKASKLLEELAAHDSGNREIGAELALTDQMLGDLEGHPGLTNLGDPDKALSYYRKALALYEAQAAAGSDASARRGTIVVRVRIADLAMARGNAAAVINEYRSALKTLEDLSAADTTNAKNLGLAGLGYRKVGSALDELGDQRGALDYYGKAARIHERLTQADPDNVQAGMALAITLRYRGDLLLKGGDRKGAAADYQGVLDILEKLSRLQPDDVLVQGRRAEMLLRAGGLLGSPAESRKMTSEGLQIFRKLAAREDATPDELFDYASGFLTCTPADLREPATAVEYAGRAVEKSGGKDREMLDLLAQAHFQNGDAVRAVQEEERALNVIPGSAEPAARREMEARLARYRTAAAKAQQN